MDRNHQFQKLFKLFCEAHPTKTRNEAQILCTTFWNGAKQKPDVNASILEKEEELAATIAKRKWQQSRFFLPATGSHKQPPSTSATSAPLSEKPVPVQVAQPGPTVHETPAKALSRPTPKQDELRKVLNVVNADIAGLEVRKQSGLMSEAQGTDLQKLLKRKHELEKQLEALAGNQQRQSKFRQDQKRAKEEMMISEPRKAAKLKYHQTPGRPRLDNEDAILEAIVEISQYGASAQDRRRFDQLKTVKTLDELVETLQKDFGFNVSRSCVYYHLQPRRSNSLEAKRHVNTVPVRLTRASNDLHKFHSDTRFCAATIRSLDELASFLGPQDVARLSQDDKARVPLGLTAAKVQAPMLMHLDYRVRLPDHDWVIASKHKLIPSVIAGTEY